MEINPASDRVMEHLPIYEFRCPNVLGFRASEDGECFYYMDHMKNIIKLRRITDSKLLYEEKVLQIKSTDKAKYTGTGQFPKLIINEKFMMFRSKIFYLFERPLAKGILDTEEL